MTSWDAIRARHRERASELIEFARLIPDSDFCLDWDDLSSAIRGEPLDDERRLHLETCKMCQSVVASWAV